MFRRAVMAASILLAIVGVALWISASAPRSTWYCWGSPRTELQVGSGCGVILLMYLVDLPTGLPEGFSKRTIDAKDFFGYTGPIQPWYVAILPWAGRPTPSSWILMVQFRPWFVVLLGLIYPAYVGGVLPYVVRRRRRQLGRCEYCAYDLTGNESGVCPECGKPAPVRPPVPEARRSPDE